MTTTRMLVDGKAAGQVSALDRGLSYGDGLFESIRLVGTVAPLWSRHMDRLVASCERLRMPVPDAAQLWREALEVTHGMPQSVVRITLTRGIGERGYTPPASALPTRIVAAFSPPKPHAQALRLRLPASLPDRRRSPSASAGFRHLIPARRGRRRAS